MPLVPVQNCSVCHFSLDNKPDAENPRTYFEWTRLNFRPSGGPEGSGHIFLED
jgi:hypothetical protein